MRNASKNTIKRIMRRAWQHDAFVYDDRLPYVPQWNPDWIEGPPYNNYFLFNWVGAQIYRMSQGAICNREPKGYTKYFKGIHPKLNKK